MIDLFMDLSDTSQAGQFYRSVAVSLLRDGTGRVVSATSFQRHQLDGWEELIPRFDDPDEGAEAQLVLGWSAVDEVHRRLHLAHWVLVERVTELELTSMRRNILSRARSIVATEPSDEFELDVVPYCYDRRRLMGLQERYRCPGDIVYAIGPWATTRMAVDFYLYSGHELGRLLVISEDCPICTKADWLEYAGSSTAAPPGFVTGRRALELDEWKAHAQGSVLYCRADDTYRRLLAAAAGNLVCTDDGDCPWGLLDELRDKESLGSEKPELVVNGHELVDVDKWVLGNAKTERTFPSSHSLSDSSPTLRPTSGPSLPQSTGARPMAKSQSYKDGFNEDIDDEDLEGYVAYDLDEQLDELEHQVVVVVPHFERGVAYLRPAIECAVAAIGEESVAEVLVVDLGASLDDELVFEALLGKWTLVWVKDTPWNISIARNVGAYEFNPIEKTVANLDETFILFLDADVLLPLEWRKDAAAAMATGDVLIPRVVQGTRMRDKPPGARAEPAHVRGGTGMPMVPWPIYSTLHGFDESFQHYGNEDIDFLARAREQVGVMVQAGNAVCYHNPHPPWSRPDIHKSEELGDPERAVNEQGWGDRKAVVVVRRGRLEL